MSAVGSALVSTLFFLVGCGGGGTSLIGGSPSTTITLDAGQSTTLTASVVNDLNNAGVMWSVSGPGTLNGPVCAPIAGSTQRTNVYQSPQSVAAVTNVIVTATSVHTPSQSVNFKINVVPAVVITSPATLPSGTVNVAYTTALTAMSGSGTLVFGVAAGSSLPAGLNLGSNGVLFGTPTAEGTFTFTLQVRDNATKPFATTQVETITINPAPPVVTTMSLPSAVVGVFYSQQLAFAGGTGTGTWTLTSGALPAGLSLSASGVISGTPAAGTGGTTAHFSVQVTSGTQTSSSQPLTLTVVQPPVITTTSLPAANLGASYLQQLTYTGGSGGSGVWTLASGSLPAGLMLSQAGVINGTPNTLGTANFSVTVTVGGQTSAAQALSITVTNLIISSGNTASGEVNLPFNFLETVIGGTAPYTWTLASGSNALPAGLSLNSSTGTISGTPTTAATTSITVQVTDSTGSPATQAITITINPARTAVNNAELLGTYAFVLSGFDAAGNPVAAAGNFTATGAGVITTGTLDLNGTAFSSAVAGQAIASGAYNIGADGRGKLALTTTSTTYTFVVALRAPSGSAVSAGGTMNEFDLSGESLSGLLALQDPTAFTTLSLNGGYALGLEGFLANAGTHVGLIGELQLNGTSGSVSSGEFTGTLTGGGAVPNSGGVYSVLPAGRGTASLTLVGGEKLTLAIYPVSAKQLFLLSLDASSATVPVFNGQALAQTIANGNFSRSALNGVAVARIEHTISVTSTPQSDVELGLMTFNGAGVASFAADKNSGGVVSTLTENGTYTVAANGRVALSLSAGIGGCVDCSTSQTIGYLAGADQGFLLDFAGGAGTGSLEPQSAGALSLSGNYALGSVQPAANGTLIEGVATLAAATGSETVDSNTAATLAADLSAALTTTTAANGRVAVTLSDGSTAAVYIVSPTRALALSLSATVPVEEELQQ